jgi:hypothetical protein
LTFCTRNWPGRALRRLQRRVDFPFRNIPRFVT